MHVIFDRIQNNDLEGVQAILAEDPAAARASHRGLGSTPLHFAAHRGFTAIVAELLEAGADVHARERVSDSTPLHWAAEGGHPAIVRLLLDRGARIDPVDAWWELTPIGWATVVLWNPAFHEHRAGTAELLLLLGATLDVFSAVGKRDVAAVRTVVTRDRDSVNRRLGFVGFGMRPLHLAIDRGLGDVAALLLDSGADVNAASDLGFTPLAHALAAGNLGLATLLRDRGATDDGGCALAAKDVPAMERALAGAPRESLDRWLFAASRSGYAEGVAALLRRGADANAGMKHLLGETPARVSALHAAVRARSVATARALLDAGADPNAGAAEGLPTPLHQAAGAGNLEMVALLLERGADRAARDGDFNATPAGWAEFAGHADVAGALA